MRYSIHTFVPLAALCCLHCGDASKRVESPAESEVVQEKISLDPLDYMPADSSALVGGNWSALAASDLFEGVSLLPFHGQLTNISDKCGLDLNRDISAVLFGFGSDLSEGPTTVALRTEVPKVKVQECLVLLGLTGGEANQWNVYWPAEDQLILSSISTTAELRASGVSKGNRGARGAMAHMDLVDQTSSMWAAAVISPELVKMASLPLSPTVAVLNLRSSLDAKTDLTLLFADEFGVKSGLELFEIMKAPVLSELNLRAEDVVMQAKESGLSLEIVLGTKVIRSTYQAIVRADLARANPDEEVAVANPSDIPAPPDVAAPPADALKTSKGVYYKVLSRPPTPGGIRDMPAAHDSVEVHYTGWTTDGKMFDSSRKRGQPATFPLNAVIAGWTDGLQQMAVGENCRFWIPEDLAYKGRKGAPEGMLVFDVELLSIKHAPKVPADLRRAPKGARKTAKGIKYKYLKRGKGRTRPKAWDKVEVHYTGWTQDGKMFDSSVKRGRPAKFPLSGVIDGWTDVMQRLRVGDSIRVWIPKKYAYKGASGKPAGLLVFDIELLGIESLPKPPAAPRNVRRAPKSAKQTALGTVYKVLKQGHGASPKADDKVEVHYTGWTTDGKMFDSSVSRGRTATFPLTAVIAGWTDGLQTMKVGGKTRFWIPEKLAYKGASGKPAGTLVFDVELISIKPAPVAPILP